MGRRGGLGRGLGALIPAAPPAAPAPPGEGADVGLREVPVDAIHPNPRQPRTVFDPVGLDELAASIRLLGVLQPILVRPDGAGFELVAGERRWRAARLAGLSHLPALVRPVDDRSSLEHAVVENIQRAQLSALEEAAAYAQLMEDFALTQEQVADRVGKSRAAVANTLRLLKLPPPVLALLADESLTAGHVRALLGLEDPGAQTALAQLAVAQGWSVRRVEEEVRRRQSAEPERQRARPGSSVPRPPALLELEHLLSDHLDTRVQVTLSRKRGRVVIDFASIEDLERIYRAMVQGRENE